VLAAAAAFGFHAHWSRVPEAAAILALVVATYFGVGMIAGAMIIAFRRTGALQTVVIVGSAMFGGVTYPPALVTQAVSRYSNAPDWIGRLVEIVPLTYGLRAVRKIAIDDAPLRAVLADVGTLALFCFAFLSVGSLAMSYALRRARAEGTLSQY
jgi:ABC-type polysaccharide/polyol phosphate export permease